MRTEGRNAKKRNKLLVLLLIALLVITVVGVGWMIRRSTGEKTQILAEGEKTMGSEALEPGMTEQEMMAPRMAEQNMSGSEVKGLDMMGVDTAELTESDATAVKTTKPEETGEETMNQEVSGSVTDQERLQVEVERYLSEMPLEDKVAQLFFVTPEALTGTGTVTRAGEKTRTSFVACPVGGIIYLGANLVSETQTREMLRNMQQYSMDRLGLPIFLGVDEEGGRAMRVGGNSGFSIEPIAPAAQLAAAGEEAVAAAADTIGGYLSDLGFNLDFAPCVDVLTNPANEVIGDRSFGSDPEQVALLAWRYAEGLRAHGILPCYKHFPGHGGTLEDTHKEYAYSYKTLEEMRASELIPFIDGSGRGIEMIMAAHISMPKITGGDLPASLSYQLITEVLRDEIGYQGIVLTDALNMGAVSEHYTSGESAVLALQAGCDMLLMASDLTGSCQAVLDAVAAGELTEERIDASVRRILTLKLQM